MIEDFPHFLKPRRQPIPDRHRCCFMALNLKPHSKPVERVRYSPERGAGIAAQVLSKPDPEPPEFF